MNVTPLVDVVLVLLIIFMVVAPRMEKGVQVELPGVFNPDPETPGALDPLELSADRDGGLYLAERRVELDEAIDVLSAEHAEAPLRRLVLRADQQLSYGAVRRILARTQQVGFPGLSLVVGERARPEEGEQGGDPWQ